MMVQASIHEVDNAIFDAIPAPPRYGTYGTWKMLSGAGWVLTLFRQDVLPKPTND